MAHLAEAVDRDIIPMVAHHAVITFVILGGILYLMGNQMLHGDVELLLLCE